MIPIRGLRAPVVLAPPLPPQEQRPHDGRCRWTEDMDGELRRLWVARKTCRVIAEAIGRGLTKNAVIARANRLGLASRIIVRGERWG